MWKMVDLRGFARPPEFKGVDSEWVDYRFKMLAVCELLELADLMRRAETYPQEIRLDETEPEVRRRSAVLYSILVQTCTNKALSIVRLVRQGNGFEAWRRMCREFAPRTATRHAAMLTGVLTPK